MKSKNKNIRICIITPDIVGPTKNGGIGTHAFYLAKFLSQEINYDITVLFTGPFEKKNLAYWKNYYQSNFNINFLYVSELPSSFPGTIIGGGGRWFIRYSLDICNWLRKQNFHICHFQDWQANGFVSIQAKRTGQAFQNTLLTCMMHSSSQWIREGMQKFPVSGSEDLIVDYAERYCVEFADLVLSPSEHMLRWATSKGWNINKHKKVIPYLLEVEQRSGYEKQDNHHIIFFGRLETRKGIEVFLDSLKILEPILKDKNHSLKITFLGKIGQAGSQNADKLVKQYFKKLSDIYSYVILSNYGHTEALEFLTKQAGALIVIPSLVDNLPFAVLECVELKLNVIAANTGGIPEIFEDTDRLFEPNPKSLAEKIQECIFSQNKPLKKRYSSELARELWREFHIDRVSELQLENESLGNERLNILNNKPLVSVCIPYFNHGKYLPQCLKSLEQQTYSNFEVVVINDGSTEQFSNDTFEEMKLLYNNLNWHFWEQENSGVGKARNFAAQQASSNYLIFMDADNLAEPEMIEKMVKAILCSGIDCLTCYFRSFKHESDISLNNYYYACVSIGGCIEAGIYENVFGDANFIIDKEVFFKLGGFNEKGSGATADWEFLASLVLAGYSLDVIPDYLVLYRYIENSLLRSTSMFEHQWQALEPYLNTMPLWQQRFIINAVGESSDKIQPLAPEELGLPKPIFLFLRSVYLKLSSGGLENKSPNLFAQFLNFIALQINRSVKN